MPELTSIGSLPELLAQVPRGLLALVGFLVLVAGGRIYPLAIMAPGLALGIAAGVALPLTMEPSVRGVVAVVLGGALALLCRFIERLAIWAVGAVVTGGLVHAAWPLVMGAPTPWWGAGVGAAAGLLLLPTVFRAALKPITAVLGALMLAYAAGMQDNLLLVGGLSAFGAVVQFGFGKDEDED